MDFAFAETVAADVSVAVEQVSQRDAVIFFLSGRGAIKRAVQVSRQFALYFGQWPGAFRARVANGILSHDQFIPGSSHEKILAQSTASLFLRRRNTGERGNGMIECG